MEFSERVDRKILPAAYGTFIGKSEHAVHA